MKVRINAELHNGMYRGNSMTKVIEVDDEDVEDCDEQARDRVIREQVEEAVLSSMVGWDWEIVP